MFLSHDDFPCHMHMDQSFWSIWVFLFYFSGVCVFLINCQWRSDRSEAEEETECAAVSINRALVLKSNSSRLLSFDGANRCSSVFYTVYFMWLYLEWIKGLVKSGMLLASDHLGWTSVASDCKPNIHHCSCSRYLLSYKHTHTNINTHTNALSSGAIFYNALLFIPAWMQAGCLKSWSDWWSRALSSALPEFTGQKLDIQSSGPLQSIG